MRLDRRRAWDSENCGKRGGMMGSETEGDMQ